MPTIIDGARASAGTQGILAAKRKTEMHDEILLLDPTAGPFTVLLKQLPRDRVINPKFDVLKDELIPETTNVNKAAGYTAGDTTIVVDNEEYAQDKDLVKVPKSGEVMRITSVSATDSSWTVSRSFGATAAAALTDNQQLLILSSAVEENSSSRTAKSTKTTSASNFIQIARDSFQVGDILDASDLYGGDELVFQTNKKGVEHLRKIEWSLWFSEKKEDTSNTDGVVRSTGGVDEHITTNETDFGGIMNEVDFEAFLRAGFRHGENNKMFFVSREVASEISLMALGRLELMEGDDTFGLDIVRYVSPHGVVNLTVNDLFSEVDEYKERGYLVDMSQYRYTFMTGEFADDTTLWTNIQNNDVAARTDEYRTYFGLWRGHEKPSSRLKGVVAG